MDEPTKGNMRKCVRRRRTKQYWHLTEIRSRSTYERRSRRRIVPKKRQHQHQPGHVVTIDESAEGNIHEMVRRHRTTKDLSLMELAIVSHFVHCFYAGTPHRQHYRYVCTTRLYQVWYDYGTSDVQSNKSFWKIVFRTSAWVALRTQNCRTRPNTVFKDFRIFSTLRHSNSAPVRWVTLGHAGVLPKF
jgi:hypothetical protein